MYFVLLQLLLKHLLGLQMTGITPIFPLGPLLDLAMVCFVKETAQIIQYQNTKQ